MNKSETNPQTDREVAAFLGRKHVRIGGTSYGVRMSASGHLEVCIDGTWRSQNLFRVEDEESLQVVVEIMLIRYGKMLVP